MQHDGVHLTPVERRALAAIEAQLASDDPALERALVGARSSTRNSATRARKLWIALAIVGAIIAFTGIIAGSMLVPIVGALVTVGAGVPLVLDIVGRIRAAAEQANRQPGPPRPSTTP